MAAVSVGIVAGDLLVDLCYEEDRTADVDANLVMAEPDGFVELQATAERNVFPRPQLDALIDMGQEAIGQLFALQHAALDE